MPRRYQAPPDAFRLRTPPDEQDRASFDRWLHRNLFWTCLSRMAELEGVLEVIDVIFPEKGTLITPHQGKPTGMRFFLMLRSLGVFAACLSKATGGRMPAGHTHRCRPKRMG